MGLVFKNLSGVLRKVCNETAGEHFTLARHQRLTTSLVGLVYDESTTKPASFAPYTTLLRALAAFIIRA